MLHHRLTLWAHLPLPEAWLPIVAQAETIYERTMKTAETFGGGDDHFRLGMLYVFFGAVLLIGNFIAFKLFLGLQNIVIKDLRDRLKKMEDTVEAQRVDYGNKIEAYSNLLRMAVEEINKARGFMQEMGLVPRGADRAYVPPIPEPPPPGPVPGRGGAFLPPRQRRISQRPANEPPDEQP